MKNRLPDLSEIYTLELKGEFRRFGIGAVSAPIGIDLLIFRRRVPGLERAAVRKRPSPRYRD